MGQHVLPGNPPVTLSLRRSPRARRISLRVSGLDGQVTLTLPKGVADAEALDFARSKSDWLRSQLNKRPDIIQITPGADVRIEGQMLRVALGQSKRVTVAEGTIHVPGPAETVPSRLSAYLKARARDRLVAASDRYALNLGQTYNRITLRDTRSRWGSCSSGRGLMYSWRLIMAPPEVLSYVAAHEVAHLQEMNHSADFWALVEHLMPDHQRPRRWLRENGAELHRYRFAD